MRTVIGRLLSSISLPWRGPSPSAFSGTLPHDACGDEPRNPLLLSAYLDDALSPRERWAVDSHLPHCETCRARLADYAALGRQIRMEGYRGVPLTLDRRIATLATTGRRGAATAAPVSPWLLRPALAVTALGLMVVVVLVSGVPLPGSEPPMVAAAYLAEDQGERTFVIRFAGPVDQEKVEQSLMMDPPITVNVEWRGQTLLVKPAEPVKEPSTYTVRVQPRGSSASETPVSVRFDSREPVRALAQQDSGPRQTRPAATAPVLAFASPSPAESPTVGSEAAATPTVPVPTTAPAIPVGSKFLRVYTDRPEIASRLGRPTGGELEIEAVVQSFERGGLLRRSDRGDVLAILSDGRWRSYADSPAATLVATPTSTSATSLLARVLQSNSPLRRELGAASGQERRVAASVQEFDRGMAIWTGDLQISVLYGDGQWQWFADGLPRPTLPPTLAATALPTTAPAAERTPTAATTPPVTPSPAPSAPTTTVETVPTATETSTPTASATPTATPTVAATPPPATSPSPAATGTVASTPTPAGQVATPVSTPGPTPTAGKKSTPAPTAPPR